MGVCVSVPVPPQEGGCGHLLAFQRALQPAKTWREAAVKSSPMPEADCVIDCTKGATPAPWPEPIKAGKVGPAADASSELAPNVVTNPDTDLILNMLDPENGPAAGLPYQVHWLGPPRPPCEAERLATVMALGKIKTDAKPDPEIASILKLVASIFKCPAALCALFDEKRVFISEQEGNVIPCGEFPWRWTLCGWSMAFKNPQVLVIQDTLQDARFRNNEKVTVFPKVRFYCGAPLVASNGHRLGTLCFADVKPRKFDMASCVMMNNLSELVVRQLEKDLALKLQEADNAALLATFRHMQRTVDSYEHCVVLLDTTEPGWRVVYANSSWAKLTGLPREALIGKLLSEVMEVTDGKQLPTDELSAAVAKLKAHGVAMARLKDPSVTQTFKLAFKPAGKQMLDASTIPIGVPSFLQPEGAEEEVAHKFYFMTLYPPGTSLPSSVVTGSALSPLGVDLSEGSSSDGGVLPGLELAHLLGRGSWGWVYYGSWYGTPVAVKIIDDDGAFGGGGSSMTPWHSGPHAQGAPNREAVMGRELRHPFVVATLTYATRMVPCARAVWKDSETAHGCCTAPTATARCSIEFTGGAGPRDECATPGTDVAKPAVNRVWAVIEAPADSSLLDDEVTASASHAGAAAQAGGAVLLGTKDTVPLDSAQHLSGSVVTPLESGSVATSAMMQQTWMVMEFCDRGCLQDAIDRGWLRTERDCLRSAPRMGAVVATALEIASAMAYLHAHDIVHGDLTGWNVMLSSAGPSSTAGERGFVAKVADFGLSRAMEARAALQTRTYGTITHMPPELLTAGTMSKAVDVWSFGVLLWQMVTGSRPWSGLTHAQVILKVVHQRQQLVWGEGVPAWYLELGRACLSFDKEARPSFQEITAKLEEMRLVCEEDDAGCSFGLTAPAARSGSPRVAQASLSRTLVVKA